MPRKTGKQEVKALISFRLTKESKKFGFNAYEETENANVVTKDTG